jgi:protein involved in temperature-dependent protein secretion
MKQRRPFQTLDKLYNDEKIQEAIAFARNQLALQPTNRRIRLWLLRLLIEEGRVDHAVKLVIRDLHKRHSFYIFRSDSLSHLFVLAKSVRNQASMLQVMRNVLLQAEEMGFTSSNVRISQELQGLKDYLDTQTASSEVASTP